VRDVFNWAIGGLGQLFGFVSSAVGDVVGWAWDKVTTGIYTWLANGLALLVEWVWSVLDSGTTPRVTAGWFANGLAVQLGVLALAVTVAMMLASGMQAALAGRPEQILDAVRQGVWAIVASALTVTVVDLLLGVVDEASATVWQSGRGALVQMIEGIVTVATTTGPLATTFVGPLCLIVGFVGLIGLVVSLMMRSALIYLAAALAPLVWSANVLPLFRGTARKLIHLMVALIVSKLAIVVALVVAVNLIAHPAGDPSSASVVNDGAAAVGTLMSGFVCFLIAAVSPMVLYKLMPTVEGAIVGAGVAGGWGRSATTATSTALMVKSMGASAAASAATRGVAGQGGASGATAATGGSGSRGAIAGLTGRTPADANSAGAGGSSSDTSPRSSGFGDSAPGGSARPSRATGSSVAPPRDRRTSRHRADTDEGEQPTVTSGGVDE
jgi:type IV secretion system protein TrbL